MKPYGLAFGLLLLVMGPLRAQQYALRDGTILSADDVVVRGIELVEGVESEGEDAVVERTYPISEVVRLDWPEPEALALARTALATGQGGEVTALLEPVRAEFVLFAKVPGSWWTAASLLRLRGLLDSGVADEAEAAARELIATAIDPEAVGLARLGLAELEATAGHGDIAAAMVKAILVEEVPAGVHARAWLLRGELALKRGDAEGALEAFLRIPVLYGTRRDLMPPALDGSRRAYRLAGDAVRADRAAADLEREFPHSAEASRLGSTPPVSSPSS
jgi:hypothetical protein